MIIHWKNLYREFFNLLGKIFFLEFDKIRFFGWLRAKIK